jgi:hypothetical protein
LTTANSIIRQALGKLGIVAPGEAVDAGDASACLISLNTMLDGWAVESLYAYATTTITGTLPANTQTRTIGPTGQLVATPRPVRLEAGCFFTAGGIDYPIETVTEDEFNSIGLKAVSSLGPRWVFYNPTLANGVLNFHPRAAQAVILSLVVQQRISSFASLTTSYTLPPGYERALVLSLAEEVAADYEREVPPTMARNAALARRNIKRTNFVVPQLDVCGSSDRRSHFERFLEG